MPWTATQSQVYFSRNDNLFASQPTPDLAKQRAGPTILVRFFMRERICRHAHQSHSNFLPCA
jgi:hypothetical protein